MMITKYAWKALLRALPALLLIPPVVVACFYAELYVLLFLYPALCLLLLACTILTSGYAELSENRKLMLEQLNPTAFLEKSRHLFVRATNPEKSMHRAIRLEKRRALLLLNEREAANRIVEELLEAPITILPLERAYLLAMRAIYLLEKGEAEASQKAQSEMELLLKSWKLTKMQRKDFQAYVIDIQMLNGQYPEAEVFYGNQLKNPKLPLLGKLNCYACLGKIYEKTGRVAYAIPLYQYVWATCKGLPYFAWVAERLTVLNS